MYVYLVARNHYIVTTVNQLGSEMETDFLVAAKFLVGMTSLTSLRTLMRLDVSLGSKSGFFCSKKQRFRFEMTGFGEIGLDSNSEGLPNKHNAC